MRYILLLLAFTSFSFAQPLSLGKPNEEKEHSPWFNMGLGLGVLSPVSSPQYKKQGTVFVNPSILASLQFAELSALTFEFDFTAAHGGVGGWFGFEQQILKTDVVPFVEAQIGARHPGSDKRDPGRREVFGPAGSLNGGVVFFRESKFRVRLKGGYEMIFNKDYDQSWNAEVGFLFAMSRPGVQAIKVD